MELDELEIEGPVLRPEVLAEMVSAGWFGRSVPDLPQGLCVSHPDPDLWHRETFSSQQTAISICRMCPELDACSVPSGARYGVWGGVAANPVPGPEVTDPNVCRQGHSERGPRNAKGYRPCRACQREYQKRKREERAQEQLAQAA